MGAVGAGAFALVGSLREPDEPEPPPLQALSAVVVHGVAPEPEPDPVAAATIEEPPTTERGEARVRTEFGTARGFRPALMNAGLTEAECPALETALTGLLDFRRCQPDDTLVLERDAAGGFVLFEYHDEDTSFVKVTHDGEGYHAERVQIPVERTHVTRAGTVRTSLGDAVDTAGLGRNHVGLFIEVFEGRVNFSTHARAGDVFRVVLDEERMNGELLGFGQVHAIEYVGQRAGTLRGFYFAPSGERGDWYDEDGRALRGGWLRTPTRYDRISSPFDPRRMHPILRRIVPHNGIDFAASTGTPVWAAADGVITWAQAKGANGNLVSIRHDGGYETHYAHLHQIQRGIRNGVNVEQRQLIGTVGTTGRSTGPHLHFGLKRNGRFLDPLEALNGPGRMMASRHLPAFRRMRDQLLQEMSSVPVRAPTAEPAEEDMAPAETDPEVMD